jgi:predicted ATP-grasp superfamily ATP-dependent carboligase
MKYALIIDSFRSHNALAHVCFTNKIAPILIFSSKKSFNNNLHSVTSNYFAKAFIYNNIDELQNELQDYLGDILFVFSCSDEGQTVKDSIDKMLGFETRQNTSAIYNKFELYKLLGQPASDSNFLEFSNKHKECIVKPNNIKDSGGCLSVQYTNTALISDQPGMFISKFFSGDEYAVDFVSHRGKHKLVSIWKYVRSSDEKVWKDKVELLPYDETFSKLIYNAAVNWLNKIQHKTGPVHMELRYNGSEFFCVEINFRLNGHMHYGTLAKGLVDNQIDLTLNALTIGSKFNGDLVRYSTRGFITRLYLNNKTTRSYAQVNWKSIETAPSFDWIFRHVAPWDTVEISNKTYQSTTAIVILFNKDYQLLEEHEKNILDIFNQIHQN